jgi:hypothetical protein
VPDDDTTVAPRPADQKAPEKRPSKDQEEAKKKAPLKPSARKR